MRRLVEWLRPRVVLFVGLAGWRAAVDREARARPAAGALRRRRAAYVMPSTSGPNAHATQADIERHLRAAARRQLTPTPAACSRRSGRGASSWRTCPTDVFGTSSMNTTSSGSHHLATRGVEEVEHLCLRQLLSRLHHDARERALDPLLVGHADDRGLGHLRVGHDLVLQLDRADPLAAGLHQILGAVDEADVALGADRRPRRRCAASRRSVNDSSARWSL